MVGRLLELIRVAPTNLVLSKILNTQNSTLKRIDSVNTQIKIETLLPHNRNHNLS